MSYSLLWPIVKISLIIILSLYHYNHKSLAYLRNDSCIWLLFNLNIFISSQVWRMECLWGRQSHYVLNWSPYHMTLRVTMKYLSYCMILWPGIFIKSLNNFWYFKFVVIYFWGIFIVISISLVCFIHAWILEEKNDSFHTHMKLNMSCTEILCNYKKNVGVNNSTNINKANNHLLSQLMELKKDHNIWRWKFWSWLGRG